MNDPKYWIALSQFIKIGPKRFQLLNNHFPDMQSVWQANFVALKQAGLDEKIAEEFVIKRQDINPDEEMEKLAREEISVLTLEDKDYPLLLKEIHNPPFVLYYKGNINNLHEQTIAVVGTRRISNYGQQVTLQIVSELIQQEIIIVSGLALGVDGLAHQTAVKNKKTTIAVIGSGLDKQNIYPATHRSLANEIIENNGLIISEYPIGMLPLKHNFPARNRIIAGLSLGTLVIEAGEHSGALITANYALEQNREVFAIPGPITNPLSAGTNNLIKQGAKAVTEAMDIFEELNLRELKEFQNNQEIIPDSPEEGAILKHLYEPRHINELIKLTDLKITEINPNLMKLEMKGKVRNLGNMTYVITQI